MTPDSDETIVRCESVSKRFCRDFKRSLYYGIKDVGFEIVRPFARLSNTTETGGSPGTTAPNLRPSEFWAVDDVSFTLKRGECLGLIGRNGAGKTTLLKMLNGLIKPDHGKITIQGRTGALIALGAGFNPILTGRENIYVNGSILGLTKREIDDRFEEIVEFADISEAIDSPVRNYSSGMNVRLGFAVAAILIQPDLLLLDEVLAVGDMAFRIKCLNRVRSIISQSAVILVSHAPQQIGNYCNKIVHLQNGAVVNNTTDVSFALNEYLSESRTDVAVQTSGDSRIEFLRAGFREGDTILQRTKSQRSSTETEPILEISIRAKEQITAAKFLIGVKTISDEALLHFPCHFPLQEGTSLSVGEATFEVSLPIRDLNAGSYKVHLSITIDGTSVFRVDGMTTIHIESDQHYWGRISRPVGIAESRRRDQAV